MPESGGVECRSSGVGRRFQEKGSAVMKQGGRVSKKYNMYF